MLSDASKIAKLKTVDVGDFQFRISKPPKPDIPDQISSVDNDDSCSRDGELKIFVSYSSSSYDIFYFENVAELLFSSFYSVFFLVSEIHKKTK